MIKTPRIGLAASWVAFVVGSAIGHAADARPNILFCLADDWGYPHASIYGDQVVSTPAFDRVAREGVLFHQAYSAAPSCTPSRAAILTGRYPHQLQEGGNLWGSLPHHYPNYVELLEQAGYRVGLAGKGWGPGRWKEGGYTRNPAGPEFPDFEAFLKDVPADQPFCFWLGTYDPHRPYDVGSGVRAGLDPVRVKVPGFWPDTPEVRGDMLDYYLEVQRFDAAVSRALQLLSESGRLENTIVVVTGDNGMPFPRAKANLYDAGTRQPLAIRWPGRIKAGTERSHFVNLLDLAPTFLDAAGLPPPLEMIGRSLLPLFGTDLPPAGRDRVFLERERHANVRAGHLGYPSRAVRTAAFLYIRNFAPERWPAGDPEPHLDPAYEFGDVDEGITKRFLLALRGQPEYGRFMVLNFGKRPAEELYDVRADPDNMRNLADHPEHADVLAALRSSLADWMRDTDDPRFQDADDPRWDRFPYYAGPREKLLPGR